MQQLLDDMVYRRNRQIRADRTIAICKFILLVTLCLTAYSCALDETHGRTSTAKEAAL